MTYDKRIDLLGHRESLVDDRSRPIITVLDLQTLVGPRQGLSGCLNISSESVLQEWSALQYDAVL